MKVLLVHCPRDLPTEVCPHSSTLFPQDLISPSLRFLFLVWDLFVEEVLEDLLMLHVCFCLCFFSLVNTCIKLNSPDTEQSWRIRQQFLGPFREYIIPIGCLLSSSRGWATANTVVVRENRRSRRTGSTLRRFTMAEIAKPTPLQIVPLPTSSKIQQICSPLCRFICRIWKSRSTL